MKNPDLSPLRECMGNVVSAAKAGQVGFALWGETQRQLVGGNVAISFGDKVEIHFCAEATTAQALGTLLTEFGLKPHRVRGRS